MKGTLLDELIMTGHRGFRVKDLDQELPKLDDPREAKALVGAYFLPRSSEIEKQPKRFHPAEKQNVIRENSRERRVPKGER